jgi:PAS domain S-box-containing protein
MQNPPLPNLPNWALWASRSILSSMFSDKNFHETISDILGILTSLPELELTNSGVVYADDGKDFHHKLLHHSDISWANVPTLMELQDEPHIQQVEFAERAALRVPLIQPSDCELIGTLLLFPRNDQAASDETSAILMLLAGDLARVIAYKKKVAVDSQLADIAGISPNEIYLFDPDSLEIFRANHSAHIKTGYRADQLLRMTPVDLKAEMSEKQYRALIEPLKKGLTKSVVFEGRQRRRDGSTYEATIKIWMLQHREGNLLIELVQDESDHKRLLGLLHATFDAFPGGIAVLDEDLRLTFANHRLYELVDIPPEQFPIGSSYTEMLRYSAVRGDYGPGDIDTLVSERAAHARLFLAHSFERERADGTILEISVSPLGTGGGVVTYMDVTIRRRAEQELIRHRDRLEEAVRQRTEELKLQAEKLAQALEHEKHINALQRQFVSMTSHEFRTPLAIIDGAAQRIMRKKGEMTSEFVGEKTYQIRSAVSRMVELMESFLAAGRLDGGMKLNVSECSILDIVTQCAKRQSEVSPSHRLALDIDRLPRTLRADPMHLNQVFSNLFSNAVKYSREAPDVDIKGWEENGCACVSVRDRGVGIDVDDLQKMFQLYFRARTSTGIAGTGIGLNLVKQIVDLHGGEISVESEKGQGTVFTVKLPIAGPQTMEEENTESGGEYAVA